MSTSSTTTGPALLDAVHVGPMDNVAYLITCRRTGRRLLVDAAAEPATLLDLVGGDLDLVLTTHRHPDHVGALAAVVEATGASTAAGDADADHLPLPVQQRLAHGDVLRVGEVALEVVHLRGHTPGSVALVLRDPEGPDHVFTGDSLFPGGVGNTRGERRRLRAAPGRRHRAAVRRARRRHRRPPRPRGAHDDRRRTPPAAAVARARLVNPQPTAWTRSAAMVTTTRVWSRPPNHG